MKLNGTIELDQASIERLKMAWEKHYKDTQRTVSATLCCVAMDVIDKDDLDKWLASATVEELKTYVRTVNFLLHERDRVMAAIPECEVHGHQCVPHAIEWVESIKVMRGE